MKDLTKEDSEVYMRIVKKGNMDDMFEFGYVVGRAELAKEQLDKIKEILKP